MTQIISAKYGAFDTFIDVTEKVTALLNHDHYLIVTNMHFGDPLPNVPKDLVIQFSTGIMSSIKEGSIVCCDGTYYYEEAHDMKTPFNCDSTVGREVIRICEQFNIKVAVETGTFHAVTTLFLANHVETVYTIEVNEPNYKFAQDRLKQHIGKNVHLIHGSSDKIFQDLLPTLLPQEEGMILFYLDAHWSAAWPLLNELNIISQHLKDRCIIIIDDFRVPNREYQYDSYNGTPNDWKFVEHSISKCYSKPPIVYYNDFSARQVGLPVGKLYVIPSGVIDDNNLHNTWIKSENAVMYSRQC